MYSTACKPLGPTSSVKVEALLWLHNLRSLSPTSCHPRPRTTDHALQPPADAAAAPQPSLIAPPPSLPSPSSHPNAP